MTDADSTCVIEKPSTRRPSSYEDHASTRVAMYGSGVITAHDQQQAQVLLRDHLLWCKRHSADVFVIARDEPNREAFKKAVKCDLETLVKDVLTTGVAFRVLLWCRNEKVEAKWWNLLGGRSSSSEVRMSGTEKYTSDVAFFWLGRTRQQEYAIWMSEQSGRPADAFSESPDVPASLAIGGEVNRLGPKLHAMFERLIAATR
jgi:hypothetical protein